MIEGSKPCTNGKCFDSQNEHNLQHVRILFRDIAPITGEPLHERKLLQFIIDRAKEKKYASLNG
ncbi:MAG: hypothetical protein RR768_09220 [Clostridium sp.]